MLYIPNVYEIIRDIHVTVYKHVNVVSSTCDLLQDMDNLDGLTNNKNKTNMKMNPSMPTGRHSTWCARVLYTSTTTIKSFFEIIIGCNDEGFQAQLHSR